MVTSMTHHCPKKSKGGCRKGKGPTNFPYCTLHQTYCKDSRCKGDFPYLLNQQYNRCLGRKEAERREQEAKKKAEEQEKKEKKAREEREKREKAQSRKQKGIKK